MTVPGRFAHCKPHEPKRNDWVFGVATPCQGASLDHASFGCRPGNGKPKIGNRTRGLTARYSVSGWTLYPLGYFGPNGFLVLAVVNHVTEKKELNMKTAEIWPGIEPGPQVSIEPMTGMSEMISPWLTGWIWFVRPRANGGNNKIFS